MFSSSTKAFQCHSMWNIVLKKNCNKGGGQSTFIYDQSDEMQQASFSCFCYFIIELSDRLCYNSSVNILKNDIQKNLSACCQILHKQSLFHYPKLINHRKYCTSCVQYWTYMAKQKGWARIIHKALPRPPHGNLIHLRTPHRNLI